MSSQGSPHARLQRAIATGNPLLVRAAAAELAQVDLVSAFAIVLMFADREPESFEPAAVRWLGRLLSEQRHRGRGKPLGLADAQLIAALLNSMRNDETAPGSAEALSRLLVARDLPRLAALVS